MKEPNDIAEDLRKLTVSTPFTYEEFVRITGLGQIEAAKLWERILLDCHVRPHKKGWVVVHGEDRKNLIKDRITSCEKKIREYYELRKHLLSL